MNPEALFTDKYARLDTLYHLSGFLMNHWINAETPESKKEWWDKLEANQKEIERLSKLK